MILNPLSVTRDAMKAVPVVRYALALAAIALFASVIRGALPGVSIVSMFPLMVGIMLLMLFLILIARAADLNEHLSSPAMFLVWVLTLCVTAILAASVSAILFGVPSAIARLILPREAADKPIIDSGPAVRATPPPPVAAPDGGGGPVAEQQSGGAADQQATPAVADKTGTASNVEGEPSDRATSGATARDAETKVSNQAEPKVQVAPTRPIQRERSAVAITPLPSPQKTVATPARGVFAGISVFYYPKGRDASRLAEPLRRNGVPYTLKPAQLTDPKLVTNAIACSADVPVEALQSVITAFRQAGLPIQQVLRFRTPGKTKRIEILSLAYINEDGTLAVPSNQPLSVMQTSALTGCPEELMNE